MYVQVGGGARSATCTVWVLGLGGAGGAQRPGLLKAVPVRRWADVVGPGLRLALAAGSGQEDSSIRLNCFMDSSRCKALAGEGRKSPLAR